jgi:hypothetical protein
MRFSSDIALYGFLGMYNQVILKRILVVARERFELSSAGPKPTMLDHYTTGLHGFK